MDEIRIVDTTLRDGNISLWAYGMTTGMMLPALRHMDDAGFDSMEFFLSMRIKKFVREHKEDPWDWLRLGTKEVKKTRLRYHGGLHSGFEFIPECIRRLVIQTVVKYGMTLTRTSNAWNDFTALGKEVVELRKLGMETVMNLIYSISPRHTDEYYAQKARDAAALRHSQGGFFTFDSAWRVAKEPGPRPSSFLSRARSKRFPSQPGERADRRR